MSEYVYAGLTSQTIDIFIQDSSSAVGAGLSGLVFNSAGLVASYRKGSTGSRTAITLATQTVGGAYSSGGFVEIDATNMRGVYRLDLVNASVDAEGFVTLYLFGAANMLPLALRIDCRALPVDVKKIDADAVSAANLRRSTKAMFTGTTDTGCTTTSIVTSALTPAVSAVTANQIVGRTVIFDADTTTVALRNQATNVTASSSSAPTTLTVAALTAEPGATDTFIIV